MPSARKQTCRQLCSLWFCPWPAAQALGSLLCLLGFRDISRDPSHALQSGLGLGNFPTLKVMLCCKWLGEEKQQPLLFGASLTV